MQTSNLHNLFSTGNLKCVEVNEYPNAVSQKNFINGIQNANNILEDLEHSFHKSSEYMEELVQCKATHCHLHDTTWNSDSSQKNLKYSNYDETDAEKTSEKRVDIGESWSTMSIVCLQYQYEELSKRYSSLLQAYHERSGAVTSRDAAVKRLKSHLKANHARLAHVHKTLITIGDIYLALRTKRNAQRSLYQEKIDRMRSSLRDVVQAAERSRLEFDSRLSRYMADVGESSAALLLDEMRRCNLLSLENLRLRAQLEEVVPGHVEWN